MQVIQIDDVDAETSQARLAAPFDALGTSVDDGRGTAAWRRDETELAGQHDVLPAIADRPADEDFVRAPPVGVRGIEERDTKVDRAVERPDRFVVVAGTVTLRHSHAAEPD